MIELKLELNEVNGILNALGQMPYVQVKDLIAKIQAQAQPQLEKKE
jgi:hypothetical protein